MGGDSSYRIDFLKEKVETSLGREENEQDWF